MKENKKKLGMIFILSILMIGSAFAYGFDKPEVLYDAPGMCHVASERPCSSLLIYECDQRLDCSVLSILLNKCEVKR